MGLAVNMWNVCLICIILLDLNGILAQYSSFGCPSGWDFFNNRCYKFEKDGKLIFDEADAACWMSGAALLSINDFQEHKFVSDWLIKHDLQDGSIWYTSGVYFSNNISIAWEGDPTALLTNMQLWADGVPPMANNPYRRIAYARGGPRFDGYGWQVVSRSLLSPYICEMSKADAQQLKIESRDFSYGQKSLNVKDVERGPLMVSQPSYTVVFGDPLSFFVECKSNGNPPPTYTWFRKDNDTYTVQITSAMQNRYTLSAGRFTVQSPDKDMDDGTYYCAAENNFGKILSDPAKVIFGYLQGFSPVRREQETANKYEGTRISCQAPSAFPDVTYMWFFNSILEPIFEDHENFFVSESGYLYFSEVQPTDNRRYFCSVTLIAPEEYARAIDQPPSKTSLGVDLIVTGTEHGYFKPYIYTHTFPSPATRGSSIRLECIAFGSLPLIYSWRREDGRPFEPGTTLSDRNRVLTIKNASLEAEGNYICSVNGRLGASDKIISLAIEAKPYFPFAIGDRMVDPNQNLKWRCKAVGRPAPVYSWYKNGELIINLPGSIEVNKGVLTIFNVNAQKDEGMYQCGATNVLGTTFSYGQLKVLSFKPNFDKYPMLPAVQIPLGGNFTLPCRVEAAPVPEVVWLKNGGPLPVTPGELSGGHIGMTLENDLVFNIIESSDQGLYTCKATNVNGEAVNSTQVNVVSGITLTTPPVDTRVQVNKTAFLFCQASYDSRNFDLTYQWRINGYLIDLENHMFFVQSQRNGMDGLYIRFAQFTHTGLYTCEARTTIHTATRSAYLYVDGPPGAPAGTYVESSSVTSHSVMLIWSVNTGMNHGNPISTYDVEAELDLYPDKWQIVARDIPEHYAMSEATNYGLRDDQRSAVVTGLLPDMSYRFRVRAINDFGRGHEASFPSVSVKTPATAPVTAPKNIRGFPEAKVGTLSILWDPLDRSEYGGDGVGYNVYFKKKDDPKEFFRAKVPGAQSGMYTHLVGTDNYYLEYTVKISAYNIHGAGPNSTEVGVMSAEGMPVLTVKMHDNNNFNESAFMMEWEEVEDSREALKGRLKGYRIRYWHQDHPSFITWRDVYGQANSALIIGLDANQLYWASVQVMNHAGVGPIGELRWAETWHLATLDYPRFVTVWPHGKHSVRVTWQGIMTVTVDEETLDGYILRVWKIQEDIRTAVDYKVDIVDEAIIDNLQTQTVYVVRVLASSRGGNGTLSQHVYFTVGAGSVPFDPTTTRFCFDHEQCSMAATSKISLLLFGLLLVCCFTFNVF